MAESEYLASLGEENPPADKHELMLGRLNWELEQRKSSVYFVNI